MIKKFQHNLIYLYIFSLLININLLQISKTKIENVLLDYIFREILIFDYLILIISLFYIRKIVLKIIELFKNNFFQLFIIILFIGLIGLIYSLFLEPEKDKNISFLIMFYLNVIKNFIALIIFIILLEQRNYLLNKNIFFYFATFLVFLILINFYLNGYFSRLFYPFSTKTHGYNLIGLLSGILFFISINFYNKFEDERLKYLITSTIFFCIIFFSFSKTAVISLSIIFIFYEIILKRNLAKNKIYLFLSIFLSMVILLDIFKYFYYGNVFSFLDIFFKPLTWFKDYGSFYYRIEHVWLSNFDKNLDIIIFLFGEGIYSAKTHDSLYFTILSRFGFIGLTFFLIFLLRIFQSLDINKHNVISFILIFGITTEMIIQSNIINPLSIILIYINSSKKIILR